MSLNELPPGWTTLPSGDLFEFVTSGSRGWAQYYADDGALFVRIGNLDHDTITLDLRDQQRVNPPRNAEGARTRLQQGDILVSITAELGMVGLVPENLGEAYINQHIALARPRSGIDARYLAWFFASEGKRQLLDMRRGMTKAGLGLDDIRKVSVRLPPPGERHRIVAKVEALRARSRRAREALDAVPPLLEKLRQSLLAAAFRGDLTKDWRAKNKNVEPASKLLARIRAERRNKWEESEFAKLIAKGKPPTDDKWKAKYKEPEPVDSTELPELPKGWCWASLDELTFIVGGITKGQKRKGTETLRGVPYLRVANVQRGHLDLDEVKTIEATESEIADLLLLPGDVLLNEGGDRDKLGRGWVWEGQLPECIHQNHVFRARPASGAIQPTYVSHYANQMGQAFFVDQGKQTTNLASVSMSRVRRFPVALPPAEEQAVLIAEVGERLAEVSNITRAAVSSEQQLSVLDRAVLAKAFRGELVPQDPKDEPAETMLARLAAANGATNGGHRGTTTRRRQHGGTSGAVEET